MNYKYLDDRNIKMIKIIKCKIIKLIILILFLLNYINVKKHNKKRYNNRIEILKKGKKYINKCLQGSLINTKLNLYNLSQPLISVIIPAFNCEKSIIPSIRSIQNQNLSQIEIILVNDFSKDNTTKIIKMLSKQDLRIKIINNYKNMGTLYSRCIGVLISLGKYIFALDNDDMFFDEDIFDYIYKIGKSKNFDIIEFKTLTINDYNDSIEKMRDHPLSRHKNNLILHQPNLGIFPISINGHYKINDINIWGKGIKNKIYKKSVNSLGYSRYSNFVSWAEDSLMVFIIFNMANSFIFIHKYGYIHLRSFSTASFTISEDIKIFGEIFLLDIYFDYLKNNNFKNLVVDHIINYNYKDKIKTIKNKLYFNSILKKIISSNYISNINKNKLKLIFNF